MIATYAALIIALLAFVAGIRLLGIVPQVKRIISESNVALDVMKSSDLNEDQKEEAIQHAAVQMLRNFFGISLRVAVLLALTFAVVYLGVIADFYSWEQLVKHASNWYFIGISTIAMIAALVWSK